MLKRLLFFAAATNLMVWNTSPLRAATKPQKSAPTPPAALDYMLVEVNGDTRIVHAGEQLVVIRGDKLKIKEAVLTERNARPGLVNLFGFNQLEANGLADDRGKEIDTSRDLTKKSSLQGLGTSYRIAISTGQKQHGEVILHVTDPKLSHAVISINGKTQVWREGQLVSVKGDDKVKVEKVVTNLGDEDKTVDFQITPVGVNDAEKLVNMRFYEIRFSRGKSVFARIPMQVEGL